MIPTGELILHGARNATWRLVPAPLHHWREDIAQDVALYVLLNRQRSERVGAQCYRWAVQHAVRRLCFLLRGQAELAPDWDEPGDAPDELAPFPMWRLQAVWEDLTDLQRLALRQVLTGEDAASLARSVGACRTALFAARRAALRRIDEPKAFTRGGRSRRAYQRIDLSSPRTPTSEAKVLAYKAKDAAAARARRVAERIARAP